MNTNNVPDDSAISFSYLGYILSARKGWIILGALLGTALALLTLFTTPKTYQSTAAVNITPISSQPVHDGKAASSLIDFATEKQLATSASTARAAAEKLGGEWTPERLKGGVSVAGDPNGTVLKISYTDTDKQRAVDGANQLANSYLEVRSSLVSDRGRDFAESIDQETLKLEQELATLQDPYAMPDAYNTVRANTLRDTIKALQDRKVALGNISSRSGEVITPATTHNLTVAPIWWKIVAMGLLAGLFAGVVLAFIAHAISRKPADERDVEHLLGVPVWRPEGQVGQQQRWALAAEFARHRAEHATMTAMIVDVDNEDAMSAARLLSDTMYAQARNLNFSRGKLLRSLAACDGAVLITPLKWSKHELLQLQEDLASIDVELLGVIIAESEPTAGPESKVKQKAEGVVKSEPANDSAPAPAVATSAPAPAPAVANPAPAPIPQLPSEAAESDTPFGREGQ